MPSLATVLLAVALLLTGLGYAAPTAGGVLAIVLVGGLAGAAGVALPPLLVMLVKRRVFGWRPAPSARRARNQAVVTWVYATAFMCFCFTVATAAVLVRAVNHIPRGREMVLGDVAAWVWATWQLRVMAAFTTVASAVAGSLVFD